MVSNRIPILETPMNEMIIDFPGGARVDAHYGGFEIRTDQPAYAGGQGSAPAPFTLFLASLGTCAGIYVLGFCKQRGLPTEGIRIIQHMESDPATRMISKVELEIQLPTDFPEKYKEAVIRSAEQCAVKKHIENPPHMMVTTKVMA
jgi:ribosomal protein S12 methylthiotransferase accessory factor